MKLNIKYSLNDKVHIIPLKIQGKIIGIFISGSGHSYQTRYFDGLKPLDCYFHEDELSLEEPKRPVGFKNE